METELPLDEADTTVGPGDARLLAGMNSAQREAVVSGARHLRILAGAGSGKTRVLTHRIARRVTTEVDPNHVLAVTFTRKAAAELRHRLATLGLRDGVTAGTFHAIAIGQLRARWADRGVMPPELLTRKVGFIARFITSSSVNPLDVVGEIEWAKARMITPDQYAQEAERNRRRSTVPVERVAQIFTRYEQEKQRKRLVDFDDLLRLAARDIRTDATYAAARHWRFRHLFVDEFQDVNPLQFELLQAWLGPTSDLCVVGDPNQSIYAWNGADARYLTRFEHFFPDARSVTLADNYRSTPQILTVANAVLAAGGTAAFHLRANRPDGPLPRVSAVSDERAEATAIARAVRDHHRPGRPWSDQAILVRTNAQTALIEEALRAARIPFRTRGASNLLEEPTVRAALADLGRASDLHRGLAAIDAAVTMGDLDEDTEQPLDERIANLSELLRLGREFLALDPHGTPGAFQAWLTAALRSEDTGGGDTVDIATFHAAKGLEWNIVHVAGLEEGFTPISHARSDAERAEEQRLLYVALTRAREELCCTWARTRTFGAKVLDRRPSRWIEAIESTTALATGTADRVAAAAHVAGARAGLAARSGDTGSGPDRAVLNRLQLWRREQSRVADVPPHVVLTDALLRRLAIARPTTTTELLAVEGMSAVKVQRFGAQLLALIADQQRP